jgi:phage internal scaffolding protein
VVWNNTRILKGEKKMSKAFREANQMELEPKTSPAMREWCLRPGKYMEDGRPMYKTEQSHKDQCDVNNIMKKYDKQGIITHVSKFEAEFGDLTGADFKKAMDLIAGSKSQFEGLPSEIRNRFKNNPGNLLEFMENPDNRAEAIELGLISGRWTEDTDGLGEHIDGKVKKHKDKKVEVEEEEKT